MPDRMPERMSDRMSEDMPDRMSEDMPERMSEDMSDRMSEDMPEDMPDKMPWDMPDRMPEDMSDRMPEDLPVRKCINVMVGITRSKVINILTSKCASRHDGVHFFDISTSKSGQDLVCFVHFDFEMCFAPQWRAIFRHLNFQKWSGPGLLCTFWLRNVLRATTACIFSTSQLPKVVRTWCVLYILTSKCASRHDGVHFFDISTSKSGQDLVCFVHFDFEMCFAPQRRAIFRHLNFQKWSGPGVLCTFWLRNVLLATTACTFSTSQLPKVVRTWFALYILTSKCASRHNGVHFFDISTSKSGPDLVCFVHFDFEMCFAPQWPAIFRHLNFKSGPDLVCFVYILTSKCASRRNSVQFFISHLPNGLRTGRFSEPTFRPSAGTNHGKNTVFRDFPTFSRTWIFFLLGLSRFWSSFFFSSLLWLFPPLLFICPYCQKFDF